MPSSSKLFLWFVFSLVARGAEAKGKMAFFCGSTVNTANVFFGPLMQRMLHTMLGGCNKQQIVNVVIKRIAVFVVYVHTLWGICYNAMFVLPLIWLGNFYAHIHKAITRFMQSLATNGKRDSKFLQNLTLCVFNSICHCFVSAIRASRGVVVSIAVRPFCTYDLGIAKRAKFESKFFGHAVFYTKQHRSANAF